MIIQNKLINNGLINWQVITQDVAGLQRDHSNMLSKIEQYKRKQLELSHRVLQVSTV